MTSEENKIEELLKPRRKVIALYPLTARDWGTALEIGRILTHPNISWAKNVLGFDVEDFPHLFEPLPWYAERKVEDMPDFVHFKEGHYENYFKVYKHLCSAEWCTVVNNSIGLVDYPYNTLTPCTEQEYQSYISKTKIL